MTRSLLVALLSACISYSLGYARESALPEASILSKAVTEKIGFDRCQSALGITQLTNQDKKCCLGIDAYKENLSQPNAPANPLAHLSPCAKKLKTASYYQIGQFIKYVCKNSECSNFLALSHARFPQKNAGYDEGTKYIETLIRSRVYPSGTNRLPAIQRQWPSIYRNYTNITHYIESTEADQLWKNGKLRDLCLTFMLDLNKHIHGYESSPNRNQIGFVYTLVDYIKSSNHTIYTADGYPLDVLHDTLIHIEVPWEDYRYGKLLHVKHLLRIPIRYGNTWQTL